MDPAPGWIQGVAYYGGNLYVTCDDGDADADEPDHMYRIEISEDKLTGKVILEKTFDEVTKQGEIEGLSFDGDNNRFLLLYNRGARIVLGMPKGFYDGYNVKNENSSHDFQASRPLGPQPQRKTKYSKEPHRETPEQISCIGSGD